MGWKFGESGKFRTYEEAVPPHSIKHVLLDEKYILLRLIGNWLPFSEKVRFTCLLILISEREERKLGKRMA